MSLTNTLLKPAILLSFSIAIVSPGARGDSLKASSGGTFSMNLDRNALAAYYGYQLSSFWDTANADAGNPNNTGDYFVSHISGTEISAINQVFDLTAVGVSSANQPSQRSVRATSAGFTIDSGTLAGVAGAELGMTGIQGFWVPNWQVNPTAPVTPAGLVNGDFSMVYSKPQAREAVWDGFGLSGSATGWHLDNNLYFTMAVYDLSNLSIAFTDSDNWIFSGDLLMSAENGYMLKGAQLNKVGSFCLGIGAYSGCQPAPVPVPVSIWLFGSFLLAWIGLNRDQFNSI
jgi:hypothetical protein